MRITFSINYNWYSASDGHTNDYDDDRKILR